MTTPHIDLTGRRALITGGGSGIGAATARAFAAAGASCLIADIDAAAAATVAAEIDGSVAMMDVGDPAAWRALVEHHGPFDIAVLNAGVATNQLRPEGTLPVLELDDERYRRIMSVNVDGVVYGAREVLRHMVATGVGDVLVTASVAGLAPIAPDPIYGLTKHAVVGFVRSMAAAIDQHPEPIDVHISSICPGFADTAILADDAKDMIRTLGLPIMEPSQVAATMLRALAERRNGAQWVVWAGREDEVYEWTPVIDLMDPS